MNCKTENSYVTIFEYIKEQLKNVVPATILTNCDEIQQSAIRICFADASIKLFWFHYAQVRYLEFLESLKILKILECLDNP